MAGELVPKEKSELVALDSTTQTAMAQVRAEIEGAILMARHFPRNEVAAASSLENDCRYMRFAEEAFYSYPRGGHTIKGPSVVLARAWARRWGNIRYGFGVEDLPDNKRKVQAYACDLESNTYVSSQTVFEKSHQRKVPGGTQWTAPDERDLRELTNRRAAIEIRNCLLQLAPKHIIDDLVSKAEATVAGGESDEALGDRINRALTAFQKLGISEGDLERYLQHILAETTPGELAELQGIYKAIRDGVEDRSKYFDQPPQQEESVPVKLDDILAGEVQTVQEEPPQDKSAAKKRGRPSKYLDQDEIDKLYQKYGTSRFDNYQAMESWMLVYGKMSPDKRILRTDLEALEKSLQKLPSDE